MTMVVVDVPLSELRWDPTLPPRIVTDSHLANVARLLEADGVSVPVQARRGTAGEMHLLYRGFSIFRAAGALGLASIPTIVTEVSDEAVLRLALAESVETEPRSHLERAWYLARLDADHTQRAIAAIEGMSTGSVNAYVTIGRSLSSEWLCTSGFDLGAVAALDLAELSRVASQPEGDRAQCLREALSPSEAAGEPDEPPRYEARRLNRGAGLAVRVRSEDPGEWSVAERSELLRDFGTLVDRTRALEAIESPAEERVRAAHRTEVLLLREARVEERLELSGRCSELSLALAQATERAAALCAAWTRSRARARDRAGQL